jgi:uncharacterized protein
VAKTVNNIQVGAKATSMYLPVLGSPLPSPSAMIPLSEASERLLRDAAPRTPLFHLLEAGNEMFVLVVDGTRLYRVNAEIAQYLTTYAEDEPAIRQCFQDLELDTPAYVDDRPLAPPPLRAISLAVAQKCNLSCTYCYAQQGDFGEVAKSMPLATALTAVETLIRQTPPGERVNIAFLGGEPLMGRDVLQAATEHAAELGRQRGVAVGFSITTNGTMLREADGQFFESHGFAVTISVDGDAEAHDRLRPFKSGRGSYQMLLDRVRPLLDMQRRMQIAARVTVTPRNLGLRKTLDELIRLGFHSVGFSPMLWSPTGCDQMGGHELDQMLAQMIDCGRAFERSVIEGQRYPFANMTNAMQEIHRGTHRPYPCGAGAGYFGVSADGDWFACHRFVGDEVGAMGTLETGVDGQRQRRWLADRHVHFQQPCRSCWARYLCGGGCHHEVIHRGRPACDYIRGWLHYCLQAYVRLMELRPDYFSGLSPTDSTAPSNASP